MPDAPIAGFAPSDIAPPALLAMVRRALDDLETLLSMVSARSDRTLAEIIERAADGNDPLLASPAAFTRRCAEIMTMTAETIARRSDLVADLIRARDVLNRACWPANAETFRLIAFYTGKRRLEEENDTAAMFHGEARAMARTRRLMFCLATVAGVVVFWTTLLFMAVLNGRTIIADNRAIRAELDAAAEAIARLPAPTLGTVFPGAFFDPYVPGFHFRPCEALIQVLVLYSFTPVEMPAFRDPAHVALCDLYHDRLRRLRINEAQILEWNRRVDRLFFCFPETIPFFCIHSRVSAEAAIGAAEAEKALAASERAAAARIDDLTALLLPFWGFLGAAVFLLRRLMQKVQAAELDATEQHQAVIRLVLGTVLGGVIGLFFSPEGAAAGGNGQPLTALGLPALALLAGYAVEVVFTSFDAAIRSLVLPLKGGGAPQPARG